MRYILIVLAFLTLSFGEANAQSASCPAGTFGTQYVTPTAGQWIACLNSLQPSIVMSENSVWGTTTTTTPGALTVPSSGSYNQALGWTTGVGFVQVPIALEGTTGSIGGSPVTAGTCTSGTVSITGVVVGMAIAASPVHYPGDGFYWVAYVSSAGVVTVKVCALATATPTASDYDIRVLQ